ncbi:30S ribosomal protein S4 [Patescibacteria group bacterium]|nr:30S ribosomal protein S4 [Patescibacteria group bacterium]MCL5409350.1 30S ribosomal protein S4 [Patescibacteria group bacterium]
MARYTGPKRRLSRREGMALFAKDAPFIERKGAVAPGVHLGRTRRRLSEYGVQLREKQKAKRLYGILEKQFANYYKKASKSKGNSGLTLLILLESRLDNVVYKLGFASSRTFARQLVSHGHVKIDGQKVNIPSFQIKPGTTVAILDKMLDNTQVKKSLENSTLPEWLERKATVGKVLRLPNRDEMEQGLNEQLIIEYYSR